MDYSFNDLKHVIDNQYNAFSNFNKSCIDYVQNVDNTNFEEYRRRIEKRGQALASFSFFKLISDKYYRENFHSDILKFLLENYATFFNSFLELIGVDENNYKNYEVIREEANIDILIKTDERAIIIENKINRAPDQKSQIYRYYKYIKEYKNLENENKKLEVDKIVYLTPSESEPSKNSLGYDVDEKKEPKKNEYINDIKSKFKNIVGFNDNNNDIIYCLDKALESEEREDYRVFLKHYIDILKETGVGDMSVIANKFLEDIKEQSKSDKDIIDKLEYTREMIDNLPTARMNYWQKEFICKTYNEGGEYTACVKESKIAGISYILQILNHEFDFTRVEIYGYNEKTGDTDEKYQRKIKKSLDENKLSFNIKMFEDRGFFGIKFKFLAEDNKVLECINEISSILDKLEK